VAQVIAEGTSFSGASGRQGFQRGSGQASALHGGRQRDRYTGAAKAHSEHGEENPR
jgi:hypothetical protein